MPEYVSYTYKCYPQTGGGAHGITKSTKKPAGMKRGMHQLARRDCGGNFHGATDDRAAMPRPNQSTRKTGCPWAIWLEEIVLDSGEAGVIPIVMPEHQAVNFGGLLGYHPLLTTAAGLSMNPNLRSIPNKLATFADMLNEGRMRHSKKFFALVEQCKKHGLVPISFSRD
jgi:hypothetical protein